MKKPFLQSQEAAHRLDVSRSQLQNLARYIPHLYAASVKSRLWPESYIVAYAEYLRKAGRRAIAATAREFAATPAAAALLASIKAEFNTRLGARKQFDTEQVAELFSVAESTVAGWRNKGALPGTAKKVETKRDRDKPPRYYFIYSPSELQGFVTWKGLALLC